MRFCIFVLSFLCSQGRLIAATSCLSESSYRIRLTSVQRSGGAFYYNDNGVLDSASISIAGIGAAASGQLSDLNVDHYFVAVEGIYTASIGGGRFICYAGPGGTCSASFTWTILDRCGVTVATINVSANATISMQNGNRIQTPRLACNGVDNRVTGCPGSAGGCLECQNGDENLARFGSVGWDCTCAKTLLKQVRIGAACPGGARTLPEARLTPSRGSF